LSSALVGRLKSLHGLTLALTRLWRNPNVFLETDIMHGRHWEAEIMPFAARSFQQLQLNLDPIAARAEPFARSDGKSPARVALLEKELENALLDRHPRSFSRRGA
jgi:hypothetical protein